MPSEPNRPLDTVPLFAGLPDEAIRALDAAVRYERHPAGSVLFRQGQPGDALYLLLSGRLEVRIERDGHDVAIDTLAPSVPVGEIALLTGRPRSATVVAVDASTVGVLPADVFADLVRDHDVLLTRLEEAVRPRVRRTRLIGLLRDWFDVRDTDDVHALEARLAWTDLPSGDVLFEQDDPPDATWLVVSGRLRIERRAAAHASAVPGTPQARSGNGDPVQVLGEIGAGECVGEMGLLTGARRSATVRAVRDASLIRVPSDLARGHAAFTLRLAQVVAKRSRRQVVGREPSRPSRTVALVGRGPAAPVHQVANDLADALASFGSTLRIDRGELNRRFEQIDLPDAGRGDLAESVLLDWLDREERRHEHLLYLSDATDTPWSDRCLRQADHVVLIADADQHADATTRAERVRALVPHTQVSLVLVRPSDRPHPRGTEAWLERIAPDAHHHLRRDDRSEIGRLARHLTGRALTLVLSGGGARGYVHIGLLAALEEAGIEVDAVAGTSMGALVGGAYALNRSAQEAERSARAFGNKKRIVDKTLPLVAIARSRGVTRILTSMFGDVRIEDLPTPFFCVSANLSRAQPHLHERGTLWRAVRASSAIPGVFTPVLHEGDVLVDGGAMNNFPVDLARTRFGDGPLVASNAYGSERPRTAYRFPDELSGWDVLLDRVRPVSRRRYLAPSILTTLTQSTSLNAHYLMDRIGEGADLLLRYPTDDVGSLDFGRVDDLIRMGRDHARAALAGYDPWPDRTATSAADSVPLAHAD
ncbi:MAG: cyclic nucleotide-binding domain-containing protein [Trueperaceae bacterium]